MSSHRGHRLSRAISTFASDGRENETRVVSRNVEIDLNGAPGVVCQLQDHAQGTEETIEVTVVPKRKPKKLIVRLAEEEPSDDSLASPKVVVTTSRSTAAPAPNQENRRHRRGRNDENVAPTGNNSKGDDDVDEEDLPVYAGKNKAQGKGKNRAEESEASTPRVAQPHRDRLDKTDQRQSFAGRRSRMPAPVSTSTGRGSTTEPARDSPRPLSATFDFARRIGHLAPWKSSRTATADKGKTRDTGNHRESSRHSYDNRKGDRHHHDHDHDHDHNHNPKSGRPKSSRGSTPTTGSFDLSTPGSYLEDYEHCCHSCGKPRCDYIQDERLVRENEKVKPSLCSSCQAKLYSDKYQILGPDGKDLSQKYWCSTCGFLRSTRYHITNGFPGTNPIKDDNICSWCIRQEERRDQERRRKIDQLTAKLTKKNTKLNENIADPTTAPRRFRPRRYRRDEINDEDDDDNDEEREVSPSSRFYTSTDSSLTETNSNAQYSRDVSPLVQEFASSSSTSNNTNNYNNQYLHVPSSSRTNTNTTTRTNSSTNTTGTDNNRHQNVQPSSSSRSSTRLAQEQNPPRRRHQRDANIDVTSHGTNKPASPVDNQGVSSQLDTPMAANDNASVPKTTTPQPATVTEDSDDDTSVASGGFLNNPEAAWASIEIDDVLRRNMEMDPRERAERLARFRGPPSDDDDDDASSVGQVVYNLEIRGPRIVELGSDDEE